MNENLETKDLIPCEEETEIMETNDHSGVSTGLAIVIGSGLIVATIVGVKKLKKLWDKHKAKREESSNAVDVCYACEETEASNEEISSTDVED